MRTIDTHGSTWARYGGVAASYLSEGPSASSTILGEKFCVYGLNRSVFVDEPR